MTKKNWLCVLGLVPFLVILDQLIKFLALSSITVTQSYGPIGLSIYHNPGVFLGTFSTLPPVLRIVSLSTGGGFLIFLYAVIQYLIPRRSLLLRVGMSFLLGGVLGNVVDRVWKGAIVDFIFILFPWGHNSPIFNLADFVQWVGYFMVVAFVLMHSSNIWPSKNERKKIWINPSFQLKYVLILLITGLGFSIISGIYSYTYLKIAMVELMKNPVKDGFSASLLSSFSLVFCIVCVVFLSLLVVLARLLSHRTAGPLYAFEKFLEDILKGKDRPLRLRIGDEFGHLEEVAEKVRKKVKENFSSSSLSKRNTRSESKRNPRSESNRKRRGRRMSSSPHSPHSPHKKKIRSLSSIRKKKASSS